VLFKNQPIPRVSLMIQLQPWHQVNYRLSNTRESSAIISQVDLLATIKDQEHAL
jgi:hypothetical protein